MTVKKKRYQELKMVIVPLLVQCALTFSTEVPLEEDELPIFM